MNPMADSVARRREMDKQGSDVMVSGIRNPYFPDFELTAGGWFTQACVSLGLARFSAVAEWLTNLPYGYNTGEGSEALFAEGLGTCMTKHGVAAHVAAEHGFPLYKYAGFYRLDETFVRGVGVILEEHGLPFLPQMHCVLGYSSTFYDLTHGNCHGKEKDIVDMDLYLRVEPDPDEAHKIGLYRLALAYYGQSEPSLAALPEPDYFALLQRAGDIHKNHCAMLRGPL